jgi:hypothetical protein
MLWACSGKVDHAPLASTKHSASSQRESGKMVHRSAVRQDLKGGGTRVLIETRTACIATHVLCKEARRLGYIVELLKFL